MTWWMWIAGAIAFAILEALTGAEMYMLLLGAAAFLVGVLAGLGLLPELWMQLAAFSAASAALIVPIRRKLTERMKAGMPNKEVDATVGRTVIAIDPMAAGGRGRAELRGSPWSAVNVGDESLAPGALATVERVEGLTLYIRPEQAVPSKQGG